MGSSYSAFDYIGSPLGIFLAVLILIGIPAVIIARKLVKRYQRIWIGFLPSLLIIAVAVVAGSWAVPVLEASGDVVDAKAVYTAAGQVQGVRAANNRSVYFINGRFCSGAYLMVDEAEYYVIDTVLPEPGTWVVITHTPEARVILSWQPATEDIASQIPVTQPDDIPDEQISAEISPQRKHLGQILSCVGFFLFSGIGVLLELFWPKLQNVILDKDREYRNEVVPNPTGFIFCPMVLVGFTVIMTGIYLMNGAAHGFLVLIMGVVMMLATQVIPMLTRIRVEGKWLVISRFGQKRRSMDEIAAVEWIEKKKSISGWAVVIRFHDRDEWVLSLDHYWGLADLYRRLSKRLR